MTNSSSETATLRILQSISQSLREQNRIFEAMNENIVAVGRKFNEWLDSEEVEDNPNQMYISDVEKKDSGDYPAEG